MATFTSNSAEETVALGRTFATELQPGAVLALQGDLGAGKTQLVKGIVSGLRIKTEVTSPTFTLIHEYSGGRLPVYHFDFFRLESEEEARRLAPDEYFYGDGVSLVEWADRFPRLIPAEARWIRFEIKSEGERLLHVS